MSNSRILLTVAGASALALGAATLIVVAIAPRDERSVSATERESIAPVTPAPTPPLDMSRVEEVAAMEPLDRCKFDLAVDLAPDATYTWEEICALHGFITSGDFLEAIGSSGTDISYGWSVDPATGSVHFDVSEPWGDEATDLLSPFGDLVEVTEGPLMQG